MSSLLFRIIPFLLVCAASAAFAQASSYETLEEFMLGLEGASTEEFVGKASQTSAARLSEWREILLEQNPVHFERWNKKLGEIPGVGFTKASRPWTLELSESRVRVVGFGGGSSEGTRPFESITDFYRSLVDDTMEVFQARYRVTAPELKKPWVSALKKQNHLLYGLGEAKLMMVRRIGFGPPVVEIPKDILAAEPIGFKSAALAVEPPKPILSYKEFVALIREGELSELGARMTAMPKAKLKNWVTHLKRTNRQTYRLLLRRLESRPVVGFGRAGEEVLDVLPLSDAPTASRPIGFRPESLDGDCPVEMVLDMLMTKRP